MVAAPTLTSIAPNTGVIGTSVPVTLIGTNLTGATAVNVSDTDITVSGITVVDPSYWRELHEENNHGWQALDAINTIQYSILGPQTVSSTS